MYEVVFTQRAVKDLENIDEQMRNRIAVKLGGYLRIRLDFKYAQNVIRHALIIRRDFFEE